MARRRYRRNPEVLGIDMEDALAVAGGVWGTKNLSAFLSGPLAAVKAPIDSLRPGLGMAALELLSAWGVGKVARMLRPRWGGMATLGGGALALSDSVNALSGQVNLIGGTPAIYQLAAPKAASNGSAVKALAARTGIDTSGL